MHTEFWWQAYGKASIHLEGGQKLAVICDGDRLMELAQYHIEWQALVL
jgi:hypothetical protein